MSTLPIGMKKILERVYGMFLRDPAFNSLYSIKHGIRLPEIIYWIALKIRQPIHKLNHKFLDKINGRSIYEINLVHEFVVCLYYFNSWPFKSQAIIFFFL